MIIYQKLSIKISKLSIILNSTSTRVKNRKEEEVDFIALNSLQVLIAEEYIGQGAVALGSFINKSVKINRPIHCIFLPQEECRKVVASIFNAP